MNKYNKNISAIIIISCILCIVIALFLPKKESNKNVAFVNDSSAYVPVNPLSSRSPFKGERIFVVRLEGVISDSYSSSLFRDYTSSNAVLEQIKKATKDNSVKAIVIRVNSPGGTVSASQELYEAISLARKKKPVVITMGDVAASGGYYIAAAADTIFANPGTLTGSIGVITSFFNFSSLLTRFGVEGITLKAGKYKDIGSSTRPMTEEEKKILQSLLDDSYEQFLNDVSKGRNMPIEKLREIAQGLIYTGKQAKSVGLVDHIGDYYKALKHAQKLAKERFPELEKKYKKTDIPIEESWKSTSVIDVLIGSFNKNIALNASNSLIDKYLPCSYSRFQPLWLLE